MRESEKIDKYLDLARELKMQWNTKVTLITTVIGALEIKAKNRDYADQSIVEIC